MPDPILATLLSKARAFSGPFIGLALLGGAGGWYLRGTAAAQSATSEDIRRLDATTVKRDEFATVVLRLDAVAARTDSTNALLRRLICKQYPLICP